MNIILVNRLIHITKHLSNEHENLSFKILFIHSDLCSFDRISLLLYCYIYKNG